MDFINGIFTLAYHKKDDTGLFFLIVAASAIVGFILIGIAFSIKNKIWDEPRRKIEELENTLNETLKFKDKIEIFNDKTLNDISEFLKILGKYNQSDIEYLIKERHFFEEFSSTHYNRKFLIDNIKKINTLSEQDIFKLINSFGIAENLNIDIYEYVKYLEYYYKNSNMMIDLVRAENKLKFLNASKSNLTAIPYMAEIMADYETYGIEKLAKELDWGYNIQRMSKVMSIREIRKEAKSIVERNKWSQYQLAYLLELFPALNDVIETDYNQLPQIEIKELSEYDTTRDWITKDEYQKLSTVERNQLALDRYRNSHKKSKWQIGRDYELYIGYLYTEKGYAVDYFGSYKGLEDLGRDLIAKKDNKVLIVQCKYWSSKKEIHEKHVTQLYGTMMSYCIENNYKKSDVKGVLVTNITLSDMAKRMAGFLNIKYQENVQISDYPCIKCNISNKGEKIYHLPFDQQYDATIIDKKGEFFALTVEEAEKAGFRRAFKWYGNG